MGKVKKASKKRPASGGAGDGAGTAGKAASALNLVLSVPALPVDAVSAPVLVSFPGGPPPESALDRRSGDALRWTVKQPKSNVGKKRRKMVVEGTAGDVTYTAASFGDDAAAPLPAKLLVGAFNPTASTLDLFPAGSVLAMHRKSRGVDGAGAGAGAGTGADADDMTWQDRQKLLVSEFGSKRKQRQMTSREANAIAGDSIAAAAAVKRQLVKSGSALAAASPAVGGMAAADAAAMASRKDLLPGFNPYASSVENVYPMDSVLPGLVSKSLTESATELRAASKKPSKIPALEAKAYWTPYIIGCVRRGLSNLAPKFGDDGKPTKDKNQDKRAARLLAYLAYLLVIHNAGRVLRAPRRPTTRRPRKTEEGEGGDGGEEGGEEEAKEEQQEEAEKEEEEEGEANPITMGLLAPVAALVGAPAALSDHILATFVEAQEDDREPEGGRPKYVRTPKLMDKLVLHVCVVALMVEGFQMEISGLAADLTMSTKKLLNYFRQLGCTYSARDGSGGSGDGEGGAGTPAKKTKKKRGGSDDSYVVRLGIPLVFPKPKNASKMR